MNWDLKYSHQFLGALLARPNSMGLEWMRQHLMPFLNNADELFSRIAYNWGEHDRMISLDTSYISSCNELADLVDR